MKAKKKRKVDIDMSKSASDFRNIVWPKILELGWLKGKLIEVEDISNPLAQHLDIASGLDKLVQSSKGLIGLATRIQSEKHALNLRRGGRPWNSFTKRVWRYPEKRPSEYFKQKIWVDSGKIGLGPELTIQAYIVYGELLSVGMARTENVITMMKLKIERGRMIILRNPDPSGYSEFYAAFWDEMCKEGYAIQVWQK